MALELYINDNYIELSNKSRIGLTYQVNDFNELQNRQSNFSNQFKVPKTRLNRKNLEHLDNVNSNTTIPYTRATAKVIQDGLETVPKGFAIVESSDDFFNIVVYSGNLDFFDLIEGKSIRDLDFSDVYHDWNFANVFASRPNTSGYTYPIINWGNLDNVSRTVDPRLLQAALFDYEIIEKIFTEQGFSIAGDFITNAFYRKMITPCTEFNHKYSKTFIDNRSFKAAQVGTKTVSTSISSVLGAFLELPLPTEEYDTGNVFSGFRYSPNTNFSSNFTGTVTVTIDGDARMQLLMAKNGSLPANPSNTYSAGTHVLTFNTPTDFEQGDYADIGLFVKGTGGAITVTFTMSSGELYNTVDEDIHYGNTWDFAGTLPDIKQRDYVKKIFNQFGIIPITDSITNTVYFRQLSELRANIPYAKDWSSKIDVSKHLPVSFRANNYAQTNDLIYRSDDAVTQNLGDGSFDIADENLVPKKTVVQLPVAASNMGTSLIDIDVAEILRVDMSIPDPYNPALDGKFVTKVQPRNLVLDIQDITGGDLVYDDGTDDDQSSTDIPLCYFKLESKTDNLAFDNNLIDNYEEIELLLNNYKKISPSVKLDARDIAELDHMIPIYLDVHTNKVQANGFFYLNIIDNYRKGALTKCELIQL